MTPIAASANTGLENLATGAKSMGRAGTAIAVGDDTTVMNTNPALLANIGNARADVSLDMMVPQFGYRNSVNNTDGKNPIYLIPSAGYAKRINERLVIGVAMFNEGGSGSDYGVLNVNNALLGGAGNYGIEHFSQIGYMIITPTASYRMSEELSVGISPQIGYGMLRMKMPFANPMLGRFGAADMDGTDTNFRLKLGLAYNAGGRYGFGVAWTSKAAINAEGDVTITTPTGDIGSGMPAQSIMRAKSVMKIGWPSSLKVGTFYDAGQYGRVSAEVQRVRWSEYFNSIPVSFTGVTFNGMAMPDQSFSMNIGMQDQTAFRIGYEYPLSSDMILRTGWVHGKNTIPTQGIIPVFSAIVEDHLTFGLGYQAGRNFEFNLGVVHGLKNTETGAAVHAVSPDAANSQTDMAFWSMAFQLSYKW
ncbi:MAG: outer membrane protein transport protein [Sterolibacterium sp.]